MRERGSEGARERGKTEFTIVVTKRKRAKERKKQEGRPFLFPSLSLRGQLLGRGTLLKKSENWTAEQIVSC